MHKLPIKMFKSIWKPRNNRNTFVNAVKNLRNRDSHNDMTIRWQDCWPLPIAPGIRTWQPTILRTVKHKVMRQAHFHIFSWHFTKAVHSSAPGINGWRWRNFTQQCMVCWLDEALSGHNTRIHWQQWHPPTTIFRRNTSADRCAASGGQWTPPCTSSFGIEVPATAWLSVGMWCAQCVRKHQNVYPPSSTPQKFNEHRIKEHPWSTKRSWCFDDCSTKSLHSNDSYVSLTTMEQGLIKSTKTEFLSHQSTRYPSQQTFFAKITFDICAWVFEFFRSWSIGRNMICNISRQLCRHVYFVYINRKYIYT